MKPLPSGMRGSRWSSPQTGGTRDPAICVIFVSLPHNDVERLAVRAQDHGVRAVLAAAVELAQQLDLVERVVVLARADAVQAAGVLRRRWLTTTYRLSNAHSRPCASPIGGRDLLDLRLARPCRRAAAA